MWQVLILIDLISSKEKNLKRGLSLNRWFLITVILSLFIFAGLSNAQQPSGSGVAPGLVIPGQPVIYPGVTGFSGQQSAQGTTAQTPTIQAPSSQISPPAQIQQPQQLTPQQAEALKTLTPEQQKVIQTELIKTGGQLTPEAIETLKARPEFKGLTPEDVIKGKEALEKKEKGVEIKEPEKKLSETMQEKKVIEDTKAQETLFDRFRKVEGYQDIPLNIKPFGYDFFQEATIKVITDRKDIPVPSKYVIGPGDEVKIMLWGRVNAQYNLVVDRDGKITIPQIGPIPVAGLTFEDMSKHLIKQAEQIVGANIDITMGALKSIPIFVLGDVKRPGAYTIGSFATITDALLIAGGPSEIGSMRNVQLKRKDKIIATYDLYDLLLKGDKSKDMILQAGDVVFVPVAGPVVGIAGNVKRPAIYELKDKSTLYELFELAGGILPSAYTQQIQVERIVKNERQIVFDIDDKRLEKAKNIALQDADFVKVFNIVDKDINVFFLYGNVKRPGKYEYKQGMRIKDVIKDNLDLLPETYMDYALIKRISPPEMKTEFIPFNLGKAIEGDRRNNIELMPQDSIFIFSKWFFKDKPYVTIEGEVRKSGRFELAENARVKDIIHLAGGLTRDAYLYKGEILRINKNSEYLRIYFNVEKAIEGEETENILLEDRDKIIIHSIESYIYPKKLVFIDGEVLKPGTYQYNDGMTVKDLIFAAGNVLESAYLESADVSFQIIEQGKEAKIEHRSINLKKALEGDPNHNVPLKPYSRLFVKKIPDWRKEQFVTITGEVWFPGRYFIKKGETLSSLIERAGGYTDKAYLRGAVFTRKRVKELQQKTLEEMAIRLEKDIMAETSMRLSTALSTDEVAGIRAQQEGSQRLLDALKRTQATGRMTITLAHPRLLKGSEFDIELEDGDTLHIPTKNNVILVAGAVMVPGSFIYNENLDYDAYIARAGGYTRYADTKNMFILKVDGSAVKIPSGFFTWSSTNQRWEITAFGEERKMLEPGDTIVVPEKIQATAWLRSFRDITQILMQMAITGGQLKYMYRNN